MFEFLDHKGLVHIDHDQDAVVRSKYPIVSANDFFSIGITLFEPFGGGMRAGLEMCLRQGILVRHYLHADVSVAARRVASSRIHALHAQYPHLFPSNHIILQQIQARIALSTPFVKGMSV